MNWTGIITFLAIITGLYFLWTWLSKREANPTTQEAFSLDREAPVLEADPYHTLPVSGDIPATDPQESITYTTIYDIVVEAPIIPELNTRDIMDDLTTDIAKTDNDPITAPIGGGSPDPQTFVTNVSPTGGKTYSTRSAIQEKTVKPVTDPVKMVSDLARPSGSFGGR